MAMRLTAQCLFNIGNSVFTIFNAAAMWAWCVDAQSLALTHQELSRQANGDDGARYSARIRLRHHGRRAQCVAIVASVLMTAVGVLGKKTKKVTAVDEAVKQLLADRKAERQAAHRAAHSHLHLPHLGSHRRTGSAGDGLEPRRTGSAGDGLEPTDRPRPTPPA